MHWRFKLLLTRYPGSSRWRRARRPRRKQAQDLLRLAAKADDPADFSRHVASLKDAVEEVQSGNKVLCESFSNRRNQD